MNLRDLQYLVAIEDYGHFGKAAAACFVSQPTLSMQVKKLEERLGVKLIERTNKSVMMTAIGRDIATRARQVLQGIDGIHCSAKTAKDPYAGEFKLGIIPSLGQYLLPDVIDLIQTQYPNLELKITERITEIVVEQVVNGELDAALLALPIKHDKLTEAVMFSDDFYLAVPVDHPYAKHASVNKCDLPAEEVLLLAEGHCFREQALAICKKFDAPTSSSYHINGLETLKEMVAGGIGISLIPKIALDQHRQDIVYIPFKDPVPRRQIGMIWRRTTPRTQLMNALTTAISALY